MNPTRLPIAVELFAQWRRVRGNSAEEQAQRAFSRNWEKLLDDAGLLSALDRNDAERDIRKLAEGGWAEIKTVLRRPHFIERVSIPTEAEVRWKEAFHFEPPSASEWEKIQVHAWPPSLAFLKNVRLNVPYADLVLLENFLRTDISRSAEIPIKERSLQIFGDEKRLDSLRDSALFAEGRLPWATLKCYTVVEPLGWERGPANTGKVIVLENSATWDSYKRWNKQAKEFSAVIYGQGNCFIDRVNFLPEIFHELGSSQTVYYFGDLDVAGLKIPQRANRKRKADFVPQIQAHLPSYKLLLTCTALKMPYQPQDLAEEEDFAWLEELAEEAWNALGNQYRLAQECVGWELLSKPEHYP